MVVVLAFLVLWDVCCASEAGTATCGLIVGHSDTILFLTKNKEAAVAKCVTKDVVGRIWAKKIVRSLFEAECEWWEK